jgi:hypothetical protein
MGERVFSDHGFFRFPMLTETTPPTVLFDANKVCMVKTSVVPPTMVLLQVGVKSTFCVGRGVR